ncbi:MAG: hypothetical protein KGJ41_00195 [Rhodospirillales bacterium]|nr:hypothetical protein [Rhodospirillales bacterium]MDE2575557.1 hypothetical protein [Rhodospirillales bacterium]
MADVPESLVLDFLAWLAASPRPYGEVMEAWRTSCPRLTVWEEALDRRYVARDAAGPEVMVALTPEGRTFLAGGAPAAAGAR